MTTIKWRAVSAIVLSAGLALVFWLEPNLEPGMLNGNTMVVWGAVFTVFWLYLVVQGYPVAHGDIGSSSAHNLDNIISFLPALVALLGGFISAVGFWHLSSFDIALAAMTVLVAFYDLWIVGGAASKINRLTNEVKPER